MRRNVMSASQLTGQIPPTSQSSPVRALALSRAPLASRRWTRWSLLLVAVVAGGTLLHSPASGAGNAEAELQPAQASSPTDAAAEPKSPSPDRGDASPARSRPRAKEFIERRLRRVEELRSAYSRALERLDQGKALQEIFPDLREIEQRTMTELGRRVMRDAQSTEGGTPRDRLAERARQRLAESSDDADEAIRPGTPEQRTRSLAFLKNNMPMLWQKLSVWRERETEAVDRLLDRVAPRVRQLEQDQKRDPKIFELRMQDLRSTLLLMETNRQLFEAYREQPRDETKISALEKSIEGLAGAVFDARVMVQEQELAQLTKRVDELRRELTISRESRERMVARHTRDMINRAKPGSDVAQGGRGDQAVPNDSQNSEASEPDREPDSGENAEPR
ncbi:MAG: hypothetical protein SFZ23_06590 [Planctomycetota bacterium]|nr:hypothetical protein [Planctomycetota bacterium]